MARTTWRNRSLWVFSFFIAMTSLSARVASAQCSVSGTTAITHLRAGPPEPLSLEQSMVSTFEATVANVEGLAPLAFRGRAPARSVRVFLREATVLDGMVGVARGVAVEVERGERGAVVATLRDGHGLVVRSVRVPCGLLETVSRAQLEAAPRPAYPEDRRWRSDATAREEYRCTSAGRGQQSCVTVRGRCAAVGDGSVCGYHPIADSLVVHRRPDARSASVIVSATNRDISFADDSGARGWLRVVSRGYDGRDAMVVRGWVRRADVRWAQETPPSAAGIGLGVAGTMGSIAASGARVGLVSLAVATPVLDRAGVAWASTMAPLCVRAEQRTPGANVRVFLPTALTIQSDTNVAHDTASWVDRCP